jgi:hypothetical protein
MYNCSVGGELYTAGKEGVLYSVWELDATWDLYGTPLQLGRSEDNLMTEYVTANVSVSVASSSDLVSTPILAIPSDFLETPAK